MAINYMRDATAYSEISSRDKRNWDRQEWSLIQDIRDGAITYARQNGAREYVILTAENRILERERVPAAPNAAAIVRTEEKANPEDIC